MRCGTAVLATTGRADGQGRYGSGSDAEIVARLDEGERTALQILPRRAMMND